MGTKKTLNQDVAVQYPVSEQRKNNIIEKNPPMKMGYTQWMVDGTGWIPAKHTQCKIQPGIYEPVWSHSNGYHLRQHKIRTDEILEFPNKQHEQILNDIKKFWKSGQLYNDHKISHKRGILLYGKPGCGKSCILSLCIKYLIQNEGGIVINVSTQSNLANVIEVLPKIRQIQPDTPIIVVIEDIDGIMESRQAKTLTLNLLDGIQQVQNIVYLATTNYPQVLEQRISNRPSRFDRRYEIDVPSAQVREFYFKEKLAQEQMNVIDLNEWIRQTQNLSISHLKELIISVFVLGYQFEDAIGTLQMMNGKPIIKSNSGNKRAGF